MLSLLWLWKQLVLLVCSSTLRLHVVIHANEYISIQMKDHTNLFYLIILFIVHVLPISKVNCVTDIINREMCR